MSGVGKAGRGGAGRRRAERGEDGERGRGEGVKPEGTWSLGVASETLVFPQ